MALRQHGSTRIPAVQIYDRWWWGTCGSASNAILSLSAHALYLADPVHNHNATDVTAGNESVITWAAPPVMNHGSGGMR
ncbi:hypothetical protein Bca52824_057998 [Brassica carinata]|uniref:Uncharacterized protein n=1 Tax=Brassica carinata TaxID=52824 RepID=A0A8X7QTG5_BRACI|nr:hypothetical protein Bca52824_057998 [Brassica carinata]